MLKKILLIFALCLVASAASAWQKQTQRGLADLSVSESGEHLFVQVEIKPKNGWYIHSHVPGEFGMPAESLWTLGNHNLIAEEWSDGEDVLYQGFGINVYKNSGFYRAVLEKNDGNLPEFDISWMACGDECVPEKIHFELVPESFLHKNLAEIPQSAIKYPMWLKAVFFAFLGGLILNFMPCVFPVLFIKILSVIRQNDYRRSRIEAWAYLIGVLFCFVAIAAVLHLLKMQEQALGWGFQLQSPYFVAVMAVVFFVLALMLVDVVKINLPLHNLPTGSFLTGFLAVLVASPCAAPFMGAAIGWILTANVSVYTFYAVFATLGLGYAIPFFCAGFFPKVMQRILPKPGAWMIWLKRFFALPMLMTSAWLVWILWSGDIHSDGKWQVYQAEKVEQLADNGQKVLVDFTAKWCLTCLANEKTVFDRKKFANLVKKRKIHLFKADWTERSDEIAQALAKYGRGSVPLYVYFSGKGGYVILPQILTYDTLEEVLR